jgi:hypothetical protein
MEYAKKLYIKIHDSSKSIKILRKTTSILMSQQEYFNSAI